VSASAVCPSGFGVLLAEPKFSLDNVKSGMLVGF